MVETSMHCRVPAFDVLRTLRCRKTGRHFNGDGWTDHPEQALSFSSDIDAAEACVQYGLEDVELILRYPGAPREFFATVLA